MATKEVVFQGSCSGCRLCVPDALERSFLQTAVVEPVCHCGQHVWISTGSSNIFMETPFCSLNRDTEIVK